MRRRTAALLGLLTLVLTSCAGWHRTQISEGQRLPPRQQVRVWRHGDSRIVHAGLVQHDTLYGVPFTKPPGCDSCRIAIPMSEVDSLEFGNAERTGLAVFLFPVVALLVLAIAFSAYGD